MADLAENIHDLVIHQENNWRWNLLFQSSMVWKDIARLVRIESTRHSNENSDNPASESRENFEINKEKAIDQLIKDIILIRKEIYGMPDELITSSQVEEDLKKYFTVLNTLI
jgi:hypothetical protein